jgi:hypothetical protein
MNIAIIGWGSLLWDRRELPLASRWRPDRPELPIEFARISKNGHVTLVIRLGQRSIRAYWALVDAPSLEQARRHLQRREDARRERDIHSVDRNGHTLGEPRPEITSTVQRWLGAHDLDGAVWTGLESNWERVTGTPLTPQNVAARLDALAGDTLRAAREYVERAPPQTRTPIRIHLETVLGWTPQPLPEGTLEGGDTPEVADAKK